jgi:tetratricopeptide (TPR) repeat protein
LKRQIFQVFALTLLLVACASGPARQTIAPFSKESGRALQVEDLVLSERMAAEFARQNDDASQTLEHLIKAAELSNDPATAKTALRAALAASQNRLAQAMLARFEKLAPDSAEPRAWAVALALHMGQSDQAWTLTHSDQMPVLENRQLGEALAAVPVRERVLPFIERTIEDTKDVATALRWCAFVRRLDESDLAMILVSRVVERYPKESTAIAWRAQLKRELKDEAGALADFTTALVLDPESRFLRLALAQLEDAAGQSGVAARRVAGIKPTDDLVVQAQVAYAARSDNRQDLKAAYQALRDLPEPRNALRLKMLGTVAELLGDSKAAIDWLRQVPEGPEQAEALLRAAVLLDESGLYESALAILRGLRGKGGVAREALTSSYLIEGNILTRSKQPAAARDLYTAGLSLLPDDAQLLYARGLELADAGQTSAAEADLRRLLALEPEHADAMNALGYTLADQTDRLSEALTLIEQALRLKPNDGAILDSMGWVHLRLGKTEQALTFLRAAHALQDDVEIAAHLGEALWVSDKRDEARRIWSEARKRDPENSVLRETLRRHGL